MKNKKISIIVPVYNAENYLENCLNSLINQTYKNIQIILVDDGSCDRSYSICQLYANKDKRIDLIKQKNSGVSSARNKGLSKANGDYVIFVDSDDFCSQDMCEIIINEISNNDFLIYGLSKVYKDKETLLLFDENIKKENIKKRIFLSNEIGGYICNKVFLNKIIRDNNLRFNEKIHLCEDLIFIFDYIQFVTKVSYVKKILYYYRMRKSSASSNFFNKKSLSILDAYEYLIEKNKKDEELVFFIKYNYLLAYYKLRSFIEKDRKYKIKFLKEESIILKKVKLSLKGKIKFLIIKYFNTSYKLLKIIKDKKNNLFI